jgi:malonyl-CoA O-methyltransferase
MPFRFLRRQLRPLSSQNAYALWAEAYPAQAHNAFMQLEQAAMEQLLPDLAGRVVLDLACGTGRYGLLAQAKGAAQVMGLDNSLPMLHAGKLTKIVLANLTALPLASNTFDVLVCGLAVGHLPKLDPIFAEIGRVLKPGGQALISDLHPFQALHGAQRTFTANGKQFAVEHYPHFYTDYHRSAAAAGLLIEALLEPELPEKSGLPVVLVLRLQKL